MAGKEEDQDPYYNNPAEMPEIPDVAILHCGAMPHMKMGIKVKNKNPLSFSICSETFCSTIVQTIH